MNLERVKQILKKVNALIENLDDQGQTSAIERDLLLRYLRDLYENVSQHKAAIDTILEEIDLTPSPITGQPDAIAKQAAQKIEPTVAGGEQPPLSTLQASQTHEHVVPAVEKPAPIDQPVRENISETGMGEKVNTPASQENQTTFYDASVSREPKTDASASEEPASAPPRGAMINKFENPVQYFPPSDEGVTPNAPAADAAANAPAAEVDASDTDIRFSISDPVDDTESISRSVGVEPNPPIGSATPTKQVTEQVQHSVAGTATLEDTAGRFEVLFTEKSARDLADKYQFQKVVTIEGAMGINERMLIINELFGGDHTVFMDTVTHLNNLTEFNSAKKYIVEGIAAKFSWDKDERKEMASDFVQLVRRKFA